MCEPASFVVTKKQVFWSKNTESHHEIITEFQLKEQNVRKEYNLVCVEITPPDGDFTKPFSKWTYHLDTGGYDREKPNWYDAVDVEKRCRMHLKDWRKAKVVMPNQSIESINLGQIIAIYGTVNDISGGTVKYIRGGTVEYIYGGTVEYIYGGTVNDIRGGTVNNIRGGTVKYYRGNFPDRVSGNAIVINYGSLTPEILKSCDAVMIDRSNKIVKCFTGR